VSASVVSPQGMVCGNQDSLAGAYFSRDLLGISPETKMKLEQCQFMATHLTHSQPTIKSSATHISDTFTYFSARLSAWASIPYILTVHLITNKLKYHEITIARCRWSLLLQRIFQSL
jgi:hypothetical protein